MPTPPREDDLAAHNRAAWNQEARAGSRWSEPVGPDVIARARRGDWSVVLTPTRPVPRTWFGELAGRDVLCLASGGGQQAPILAAAGARVTSYDLADEQLARDRLVADRDGLDVTCIRGDMRHLAALDDASFDLVFNPVSVCFVNTVRPVWSECARVLRPGGRLLVGMINPVFFLFDPDEAQRTGELTARYTLPYAEDDPAVLTPARRAELAAGQPMEFSHTLGDLIGGQLEAGFSLAALYEDGWADDTMPLDRYLNAFLATLAIRR